MRFIHLFALLAAASLAGCQPAPEQKAGGKEAPSAHLVELAHAERFEAPVQVERSGTLRARRAVQISTQEEGRLAALPGYEGDRVRAGELLFALDDTVIRAELSKAEAQRRQAELDLARLERLQGGRLVSEEELARARTALDVARAEEGLLRARLGYTRVAAPFAGVVTRRLAEPGDTLPRYSHLLTLADPSSLITEVTVSELLLPSLANGDAVDVRIDALGDRRFVGRILRIHPTVDPATRQGIVEIALDAPEGAIPGQFCRVTLTGRPLPRLGIPFAALRRDATGEFVFRVAEGVARRVAVVSGTHLGQRVMVLDGLAEGDAVVRKGFLGLADGMAVKPVGGDAAAR
jgi:RND family efflux transporter MFP subunit